MAPQSRPTALVSVCCLECKKTYSKPAGGGTVWANPGCPHCGYVGWMPASAPVGGPRPARPRPGRRPRVVVALSR